MNAAVGTSMSRKLGFFVNIGRSEAILLSVVAVTGTGAVEGHVSQTEVVVYGFFVVIVTASFVVVYGGCFDS